MKISIVAGVTRISKVRHSEAAKMPSTFSGGAPFSSDAPRRTRTTRSTPFWATVRFRLYALSESVSRRAGPCCPGLAVRASKRSVSCSSASARASQAGGSTPRTNEGPAMKRVPSSTRRAPFPSLAGPP